MIIIINALMEKKAEIESELFALQREEKASKQGLCVINAYIIYTSKCLFYD